MKYVTFFSLITAAFLVGCSKQDDTPKASVEVSVNDDKGSLEGAMDKAADKIKDGAEEAKDKLNAAGEKIKDGVEDAKDKLSDDKKAEVKVEVKHD